jgi:hypothetical protein
VEKKYLKQVHPRIPSYSLQQADDHNQQLSMFDQQQPDFSNGINDAIPFEKEISKYVNNDELQYQFDPISGLWRK